MSATATVPAKSQTLDELMLAMDVVDTIRHRELIVVRELGLGGRDDALRNRLREIYKGQGIEVTDRIIDEGIKALRESRFVYTPPPPSLGRSLALVWINRGRILRWTATIVFAGAVLWGGYYFGIERPRQLAAEQAAVAAETARLEQAQLPVILPKRLNEAYGRVMAVAVDVAVKQNAATLQRQGQAAIDLKDWGTAQLSIGELEALATVVNDAYTVRIVSRPDADTGFYRLPDVNSSARNYYLVVEAVGSDGRARPVAISSEEDQTTRTVSTWAERVPKYLFDRVRGDKEDDGIVQNNLFAEKRRGFARVNYRMPHSNGRITEW